MSGTSLDGIDVAIVDIQGEADSAAGVSLDALSQGGPRGAARRLERDDAHRDYRAAALSAGRTVRGRGRRQASRASIKPALIGMHGQTIFHEGAPVEYLGRRVASTLQIGEAAVVAERTGVRTISNFRERDIAAGGQGAPLVPYVDYLLFRHARRGRVALNIGGIANITVIPAGAKPEDVIAFDTGPGNMVIDALVAHHTEGRQRYDRNGSIARRGNGAREVARGDDERSLLRIASLPRPPGASSSGSNS